jgi:dihydroxyacetone kinase-like protein
VTMNIETARAWLGYYSDGIAERVDELNQLDAALGDGDCGASLQRGTAAVAESLATVDTDSLGEVFRSVGMTLVSAMGGTSGPLIGTLFLRMGVGLGDLGEADTAALAAAMRSGVEGVMSMGQSAPGDKTMIDSLLPGVEALEANASEPMSVAVVAAATAAREGAAATAGLSARRGRASYVGDGGLGTIDPGAVGMAILFEGLDRAVND